MGLDVNGSIYLHVNQTLNIQVNIFTDYGKYGVFYIYVCYDPTNSCITFYIWKAYAL